MSHSKSPLAPFHHIRCYRQCIDPVPIGIVICLNLVLGLVTPPVGAVLFAVCGISGISIDRLGKAIWKPFIVALIVPAIVTYVPWLSTFLPRKFM